MRAALLDTNVLLALAWPNHQHHAEACVWFAVHGKKGWATCALTQLGFIRLSSNPAYTSDAVIPRESAQLLRQWTRLKSHEFWVSESADDPGIYARSIGHKQVNDAWLVNLARHNAVALVTFDSRLRAHAIKPGQVEVIRS